MTSPASVFFVARPLFDANNSEDLKVPRTLFSSVPSYDATMTQ